MNMPKFHDVFCYGATEDNIESSADFYSVLLNKEDTISVFLNDGECSNAYFDSYDEQGNAVLIGESHDDMEISCCSAFFPALKNTDNPDLSAIPVDLSIQVQNGNGNRNHIRNRMFHISEPAMADSAGIVNLSMKHGFAILHFRLRTPISGNFTKCFIIAGKPVAWKSTVDMNTGQYSLFRDMPFLTLSLNDVTVEKYDTLDLYLAALPEDLTGVDFKAVVYDETGNTYSASFGGMTIECGNIYHFCKYLSSDWNYLSIADIPVVSIMTENGQLPKFDMVSPPAGAWGLSITNATKVKSRMTILSGIDTILYDSGNYEEGASGITIKVRGNTSATGSPSYLPYKLKLQKKADLLFRDKDGKDYRDADWALLKISVSTLIGYEMNRIVGFDYAPQAKLVYVFINGLLKGRYILSETVERNADCRLNVDKHSGFIFERDPYWWNEDLYFKTEKFSNMHYGYTFKYPKSSNISNSQLEYIKSAVETMEQSIQDGTYDRYIDVNSFAAWLLGHDLLGTFDFAGSNMFFTKYDSTESSKIKMANMWDFDSIERDDMKGHWSKIHENEDGSFFPSLLKSVSPAFRDAYYEKWLEIRSDVKPAVMALLTSMRDSPESLAWGKNLTDAITTSEQWFDERIEWIDEMLNDTQYGKKRN